MKEIDLDLLIKSGVELYFQAVGDELNDMSQEDLIEHLRGYLQRAIKKHSYLEPMELVNQYTHNFVTGLMFQIDSAILLNRINQLKEEIKYADRRRTRNKH